VLQSVLITAGDYCTYERGVDSIQRTAVAIAEGERHDGVRVAWRCTLT
jgi:hypothetical protein